MATAEVALASSGPRYAPEDPTLLKPWKGLIDGSTGALYYWNPDNNITQYERPANLDTLSAPGVPPSVSTPKLAPIPVARQQGQELSQSYQSQGSQMFQQQQGQGQFKPQHQSSQFIEGTQHQHQPLQMTQGVQPQGSQMAQQQNWQPMSQQSRDQGQRMPQHFEQQTWQNETQKPLHQQGQQFPSQQQQKPYPDTLNMQGKHMSQSHAHHGTYGTGQQIGFSPSEESEFQRGKETGFPPSLIQQPGLTHFQNHLQTGTPSVQSQPKATDMLNHQRMGRPMFQGQVGSAIIHDQHPGGSPLGLKKGYETELHGRAGNDFYFNASKGGQVMAPQQSKLANVPLPHTQMGMEVPHRVSSGHANGSSSTMAQMKNHVTNGQTYAQNAPGILTSLMHGSSDVSSLSAVDVYRREHEVTASGDNVPAPFMTFEATGFPPEILREVRYLLQMRSICRTCAAILTPSTAASLSFGGCKNMVEALLWLF